VQTTNHAAIAILHFLRNILIMESVLLVAVVLLWRLASWHTTSSYGSVLTTAGEIITGLGLSSSIGPRSSDDIRLTEGEIEMQSWDHHGNRRLTSRYAELVQTTRWLMCIGILTIGIGATINRFLS
jgi:hypothetical protein